MLDEAAVDAYTLINFIGAGYRGRHVILGLRSRYGYTPVTDEEMSQVKELISRTTQWNASILKGQLPVGEEAMRRPESTLNEALDLANRLSALFVDQGERMDVSQKNVGKRPHAWALVEGIIWEAEYSQLAAQGMLTLGERQKDDNLINRALAEEQQAMELRQFGESLLTRMIGGTEFDLEEAKDLWNRCALLPGRFRVKTTDIGFMVGRIRGKLLAGDIAVSGRQWTDWQATGAGVNEIARWNAYGFTPTECQELRAAGLSDPDTAHAYRVRGLSNREILTNKQNNIFPKDIPFPDPVPEEEPEEEPDIKAGSKSQRVKQPREESGKQAAKPAQGKLPASGTTAKKEKSTAVAKEKKPAPAADDNVIEFKLDHDALDKIGASKKSDHPTSPQSGRAGREIKKAASVAKSMGATKVKSTRQLGVDKKDKLEKTAIAKAESAKIKTATRPKSKKVQESGKEKKSSGFKVFRDEPESVSEVKENENPDSVHKKPNPSDYAIEHIEIDMPTPGGTEEPVTIDMPAVDLGLLEVPGDEQPENFPPTNLVDKKGDEFPDLSVKKVSKRKVTPGKKPQKQVDPEWSKAGFESSKEVAIWKKTKLLPKDARAWKESGFKPEEAYRWVRVAPAKQAAKWKAVGVGPDEAIGWMQRGVIAKEVKKRLARGEFPDGPRSYRRTDANRALLYWGVSFFDTDETVLPEGKERRKRERLAVNENLRCLAGQYSNLDESPLSFLAVGDSFTEAGSGHPLQLKSQDKGKDWEKRLSRYCEIMDVSDKNKGWWLAATQSDGSDEELYQKTILFWGIPFEDTEKPPWSDPEHDTSYEQWKGRLNRKLAESNYTEEDVAGCHIGIHLSWQSPRAYVAVDESCLIADFRKAVNVEDFFIRPGWLSRLKAFCEVMDIPWQDPDWYIATRTEH